MIKELNDDLCAITGFSAMSFQPNSGAQGEYAGLLVIRAYQESLNQGHRNIALIPSSAHGTNPASAAMCGLKIIVVKCDEMGNIDVNDLKEKAEKNAENLSCLMVTYPSTHGVFEESIIVRDLRNSLQETVSLSKLVEEIRKRLRSVLRYHPMPAHTIRKNNRNKLYSTHTVAAASKPIMICFRSCLR